MDAEDKDTGAAHEQTPGVERESDTRKRRQAIAITSLGSIADLTAIAQLVTSTLKLGALVFGLLSIVISCLGLIRLWGSNFGRAVTAMVVLLVIGSCATGIALAGAWNQTGGAGDQDVAVSTQNRTTSPLAPTDTAAHVNSLDTSEQSPSSTTRGAVLEAGKLDLHDGDSVDLGTGIVGTAVTGTDLRYGYYEAGSSHFAVPVGSPQHYIAVASQNPNHEQCVNLLKGRHDINVNIVTPGVGAWYCVETSDYTVAAVQVQKLPTSARDTVTISYTLWKE